MGKFTLPVNAGKDGKVEAEKFADSLAEGILGRLVSAQLSKGPMVKGKADLQGPDRQCLAAGAQRCGRSGDAGRGQ